MAGHVRYTALIDACAFYSLAVTDVLMSLAVADLFAAKWTTKIEEEWILSLENDRPALKGKLNTRRDAMRAAVPDWEVPEGAWKSLHEGITLPDNDDRHVVAAAVAGHADCIVTFNVKDFPEQIVALYELQAVDPDTFVVNQLDLNHIAALAAFKQMRARRKKPQETPEQFAATLERNQLPLTAQRLREAAPLL